MTTYTFQATIHPRPEVVVAGPPWTLGSATFQTLAVVPNQLGRGFERSFEETGEALAQLPRMFFEPDGSFVWVTEEHHDRRQVDGVLLDRDGRLMYVDVVGRCAPGELDSLLTAVGWPATGVMFQLRREAIFLDEPEFRRYASSP